MTSASSLAIKTLGSLTITALWLVPLESAAESWRWILSEQQNTTVTDVASIPSGNVRSRLSPSVSGITSHTRYFSTGTTLLYTW